MKSLPRRGTTPVVALLVLIALMCTLAIGCANAEEQSTKEIIERAIAEIVAEVRALEAGKSHAAERWEVCCDPNAPREYFGYYFHRSSGPYCDLFNSEKVYCKWCGYPFEETLLRFIETHLRGSAGCPL